MPRPAPMSDARFSDKLRAITGASGQDLVRDVADLTGLITLEQDRPEWGFYGGEELYMHRSIVAAGGAGFASITALVMPAAAGKFMVLEFLSSLGTLDISTSSEANILATYTQDTTNFTIRDLRLSGATKATQAWTRNNAAGLAQAGYRLQVGHRIPPMILFPGFAIVIANVTANTIQEIGIGFRERALLSSPKSG